MTQQSTNSDKRSSISQVENETAQISREETEAIDDRGTSQEEAAEILRKVRDEAFGSSNEVFALALGRTPQEVKNWFSGNEPIDADVLLKARGIAIERGVELDLDADMLAEKHRREAEPGSANK